MSLPTDYSAWLSDLKNQIHTSQTQATLSVNREVVLLYWKIGTAILEQQKVGDGKAQGAEQLVIDLKRKFPEMKGFSRRNLSYMQQFAAAWPDEQVVRQLLSLLPWGHHIALLQRVKEPVQREKYVRAAIQYGWSGNVLTHQIESRWLERQQQVQSGPAQSAPEPKLVQQQLTDPYNFDLLTLHDAAVERDLKKALLAHLQQFLLELRVGFALVGSNYHLEVGNEDFFIDLLFYHLKLRCFVVVNLSTSEFKPEDVGLLNFHLAVVDDRLRHEQDGASLGLILCRTKNKVIAEYALRGYERHLGVSTYDLSKGLPQDLKGRLPSIEELEQELSNLNEEMRHNGQQSLDNW